MDILQTEIDLVNQIIAEAVWHGADAGGAYCQNGSELKNAIEKWLDYKGINDKYIVCAEEYNPVTKQHYHLYNGDRLDCFLFIKKRDGGNCE